MTMDLLMLHCDTLRRLPLPHVTSQGDQVAHVDKYQPTGPKKNDKVEIKSIHGSYSIDMRFCYLHLPFSLELGTFFGPIFYLSFDTLIYRY